MCEKNSKIKFKRYFGDFNKLKLSDFAGKH